MPILDAVTPGASVVLPLGHVELHWKGEPPSQPIAVIPRLAPERFQHPEGAKVCYGLGRNGWDLWSTSEPLLLRGLPISTREITVRVEGVGDWNFDIDVGTHQTHYLDVDLRR